jgi:hypothetical protein
LVLKQPHCVEIDIPQDVQFAHHHCLTQVQLNEAVRWEVALLVEESAVYRLDAKQPGKRELVDSEDDR